MKISLFSTEHHIIVTFSGAAAIFFLLALIGSYSMRMNILEPENIEDRVRLILSRKISQNHMQELKILELKIPKEEISA